MSESNPVVMAINFVPGEFHSDFIFVSNAKRYSKLVDFGYKELEEKLILTSNITPFSIYPRYRVNYQGLLDERDNMPDNALLLCIKMLIKLEAAEVLLAGFDGFTFGQNYYDVSYSFANELYKTDINEVIAHGIKQYQKYIKITFITESLYENKGLQKHV